MTDDNEPRLLSRREASVYLGVSPSTFSAWVQNGFLPKPLFSSKRWDKKAIDRAIDRASGIPDTEPEEDAFERWLRTGQ